MRARPVTTALAHRGRDLDPHLWEGVNRLIDRSPSADDLRAHRLQLLALARKRELGEPVPADFVETARDAAMTGLTAPLLLDRIRAACDGPLLLLKGPEVAACYPHPSLRGFSDLDLLAPDPAAAQRSLIADGFVPVGDESRYVGIHHLRPLHCPGFPLIVEIHVHPKWIDGTAPPPLDELFASAVDASVPVRGILALPRAQHAVVLAAHSWGHVPLGTLGGLIDVAAVKQGIAAETLEEVAAAWGIARLWRVTSAAIDSLLLGAPRPWPLRVWARDLAEARERTVLETHLQRWLAGFSVLPPGRAALAGVRAIGRDIVPAEGESWSAKLRRARLATKHATVRRSQHDAELSGEERE